ncbi:MAG: hypothetical protein D6795_19765, partial [Deltaproteobacteria bacterium]
MKFEIPPIESGIPTIVLGLFREGRSGVLRFTYGEKWQRLTFDRGKPVQVESNYVQELTLGRLLVDEGKITLTELMKSRELMHEKKMQQGAALIELGLLTPRELYQALQLQARRKILEIFEWPTFEHRFEARQIEQGAFLFLKINLPMLLIDGFRRIYESPGVAEKHAVFFETILDFSFVPNLLSPLLTSWRLSAEVEGILRKIAGGGTPARLIEEGTPRSTLFPVLHALLFMDIVRLASDVSPQAGGEQPNTAVQAASSSTIRRGVIEARPSDLLPDMPTIPYTDTEEVGRIPPSGARAPEAPSNVREGEETSPSAQREEKPHEFEVEGANVRRITSERIKKVRRLPRHRENRWQRLRRFFQKSRRYDHLLPHYIIDVEDPRSIPTEQYRGLRNKLEKIHRREKPLRRLIVTSALPGEGKTLTSINLAVIVAQNPNRRVLLIDADLRKPLVHRYLDAPLSPGLAELIGGAPLEEVVFQHMETGIYGITAGEPGTDPGELFVLPEARQTIEALSGVFDYIVIDTPPALVTSDVEILSDYVDGLLFVIR